MIGFNLVKMKNFVLLHLKLIDKFSTANFHLSSFKYKWNYKKISSHNAINSSIN